MDQTSSNPNVMQALAGWMLQSFDNVSIGLK